MIVTDPPFPADMQPFTKRGSPILPGTELALRAALSMTRNGGHFASRIGDAYTYADRGDQRRLVETFQDIFQAHAYA